MTNEKRFEKLCEAIDKAAFKWGDGLTNSDVINACLVIASYFFKDVHRDKPCAEKCFGVCSQTLPQALWPGKRQNASQASRLHKKRF